MDTDTERLVGRINQRFTSGNATPVARAYLTQEEWTTINAALSQQGRDAELRIPLPNTPEMAAAMIQLGERYFAALATQPEDQS